MSVPLVRSVQVQRYALAQVPEAPRLPACGRASTAEAAHPSYFTRRRFSLALRNASLIAAITCGPVAPVGLSTASVYPQGATVAFEMAASLGYDGVEVMVWTDPVSQDIGMVEDLAQRHQLPVLSIHAPCLLITQRVWSPDPWERLTRTVEAAQRLGAPIVVVHPPFRWQRDYARRFVRGVADLEKETGVAIAVENMYPWRAAGREIAAYAPDWDPTDEPYAHNTLDLSHTAVSGSNALASSRHRASQSPGS